MPVAPGLSQKARRRGVLVILLMNLAAVPFRGGLAYCDGLTTAAEPPPRRTGSATAST
jgi:hypothetical protein